MNEVVRFEIMDDFELKIRFRDGFEGKVNIRPMLGKGFTQELLNKDEFQKVQLEPGGGLAWPNGFDICPNHLRNLAESSVVQSPQ